MNSHEYDVNKLALPPLQNVKDFRENMIHPSTTNLDREMWYTLLLWDGGSSTKGLFSWQKILPQHITLDIRTHIWNIKRSLITKQLHIPPGNYEINLLSIINPSLTNIYCSTILSNHCAIRVKRFVSQFSGELCNWFFSTFNTPYMCQNI
jgi:hypothetical protein